MNGIINDWVYSLDIEQFARLFVAVILFVGILLVSRYASRV